MPIDLVSLQNKEFLAEATDCPIAWYQTTLSTLGCCRKTRTLTFNVQKNYAEQHYERGQRMTAENVYNEPSELDIDLHSTSTKGNLSLSGDNLELVQDDITALV